MIALFLSYALALPPSGWRGPARIKTVQMAKSEEERLRDFIERNNPGAEVYIHPTPQEEKLKEYGWERVPFTWRGNQIWIKRRPANDQKKLEESA